MKARILCLSLFLLVPSLFAQEADKDVVPLDPAVRTGTLENGLKYFIRQNKKPEQRVEMRLAVNVGATVEDDDQQGLAHFLEHMAFNGTKKFKKSELVDFLESLGVGFGPDLNAYTSFDETVYMLRLPTDDLAVAEKGVEILSEWAFNITSTDKAIDDERGVIIEERRGRRGAGSRIQDKQFPVLFHNSRYANRLPIGKLEVIENTPNQRLRDFYDRWYKPENMGVMIVGDLDPDLAEKWIKQYFSDEPATKDPEPIPTFTVPPHNDTKIGLFTDPELTGSQISLVFKHPSQRSKTEADFRQGLTQSLVTSMLNQRISERANKSNAPFFGGGTYRGNYTRGGSVFYLYASVKDEEGAQERGLKAVLEEVQRARIHGFTQSELDRSKKSLLRGMERRFNERDTTESGTLVAELVAYYLTGDMVPGVAVKLDLYKKYLAEISLKELNLLLDEWMTDENRVILGKAPEKADGTNHLADEAALLAMIAEADKWTLEPYEDTVGDAPLAVAPEKAGSVVSKEFDEKLGVHTWMLSNGVKVMLKPTDFKADQILFSTWSHGGSSLETADNFYPAATASTMANIGGFGEYNAVNLRKKMAGKLVSLAPRISTYSEGMSGSSTPADLETFFQLLHLGFTDPHRDEEAFAAFKQRRLAAIVNREKNPRAVYAMVVGDTMNSNHPRTKAWTTDTLEKLDLDASLAFYKERFANAADFTMLFTGAFELELMESLLSTWVATLPSDPEAEKETFRDLGIEAPKFYVKRVVAKGKEPISSVQMVWTSPTFDYTYANRHAARSMMAVFRIRLREVIREKLGGSYSVSVGAQIDKIPTPRARMRVGFGCDPEKVDELIAAVEAEVEALRTELVDELYITKVRELQLRQRETAIKTNGFWQYVLAFFEENGEDPYVLFEFEDYVNLVTRELVKEQANLYFGVEDKAVFVLLPETMEPAPEEDAATPK